MRTNNADTLLHSDLVEQNVLGAILLDNDVIDAISQLLSEEDFYNESHKIIFNAILKLHHKSISVDIITLSENLPGETDLFTYLAELAKNTACAANAVAYAQTVKDYSTRRQMLKSGLEIFGNAKNTEISVKDLIDDAENKIFILSEGRNSQKRELVGTEEGLSRTLDRIEFLYDSGSPVTGIPTGYDYLDNLTAGLQPSDLIIVAARPSMGKTNFALNISKNFAVKSTDTILIFSMEMPIEQLWMRVLSSVGNIDMQKIRTGQLGDGDWECLSVAVNQMKSQKIIIDDSGSLSPFEVRTRARRVAREHGKLGLIVIDYLQLMKIPGFKEGKVNEISEISRSIKSLAKELNIPIILLSQLNRSLEGRSEKRPVMSDLRDSGAIEQDADLILFIYRDEVYNKSSKDIGVAEIIIGKQRNGPIGTVNLRFNGQYCQFENF